MTHTYKAAADGAVEEIKGRAKEVAGALVDDERLEREGEAQQHKADALREAAAYEAKATAARAEAGMRKAEQRKFQD